MTPLVLLASMHSDANARVLRRSIDAAGGLVTCADLARRWHISKARAYELCNLPGFPAPVARVGRSLVYIGSECDLWRSKRYPNQEVNDA